MGGMSKHTEHFSFTLALHLPPRPSYISIALCQNGILCWAHNFSPHRMVGQQPAGPLLAPFPPTRGTRAV